jgi:tetratricopeptide (TPR) repeat protein
MRADELSARVGGHHSSPALLAAALAYEVGGFMAESAAAYDKVDAADPEPLAEVGRALRDLRVFAYDSARARVDKLCQTSPHLWEAHYARSRVYGAMTDDGVIEPVASSSEALASARRAVELAPNQALAHAQLAISTGNPLERAGEIARAIALEPTNGAWLIVRAEIRLYDGDVAGSRADAEEARKIGVAPVLLDLMAVREAAAKGDDEASFKALTVLKDRLAGWPKQQMAWAYIGMLMHRDEVKPALRDLAQRFPTYPFMGMARASAALAEKHPDQALEIVRESTAKYPYNARMRVVEGIICLRAGKPADALAAAERAAVGRAAGSDLFMAARVRIAALRALGRKGEADVALQKAKQDFPARAAEFDQPGP